MTETSPPNPMPPEANGNLSDRYEQLRELAASVNHEVRVFAIPGVPLNPGDQFFVSPVEAKAMTLEEAFSYYEEYLKTDKAKKRGDLYTTRNARAKAVKDAMIAWTEARNALTDANNEIDDDIDETTGTLDFGG